MAKKKKKKKAKGKAKGKARRSKKSRDSLVVASKVKGYIKKKGYICAGDLVAALNDTVHGLLDAATARTDANRRSTVRPQDL